MKISLSKIPKNEVKLVHLPICHRLIILEILTETCVSRAGGFLCYDFFVSTRESYSELSVDLTLPLLFCIFHSCLEQVKLTYIILPQLQIDSIDKPLGLIVTPRKNHLP